VGITMMIATYARGDMSDILSSEQYDQFVRFDYPLDEYFETLDIESLSYDFALYDGLHYKAIAKLRKKGLLGKRIIFYIPKTGQSASIGTKTDDVKAILSVLPKNTRYLDLVHEEGRNERKQRLIDDPNLDVDVIFAMNMMEEGANWKRADTVVVIGPRYSLPGIIQKMGRMMRDFPNKKHVRMIHLLPFTFDRKKENKHRKDLNDWLKAVLLSMMLEDVFCPLKLSFKSKTPGKKGATRNMSKIRELFPDTNDQHQFRVEVIEDIIEGQTDDMTKNERQSFLFDVVRDRLQQHSVPDKHARRVADQIWYELCRKVVKNKGLDVGKIDIELLEKVEDAFKALLRYTSGKVGSNTFAELRKAISRGITMDDLHALAAERGGECLGVVEY